MRTKREQIPPDHREQNVNKNPTVTHGEQRVNGPTGTPEQKNERTRGINQYTIYSIFLKQFIQDFASKPDILRTRTI